MKRLWSALGIFWAAVVSGVGLIAGYMAADSVDATLAFWLAVAAAALIAIFFWVGPALVRVAQKIQNYDRLLALIATQEQDISEANKATQDADDSAAKAHAAGVEVGMGKVLGAVRAELMIPPTLSGIASIDGDTMLVATSRVRDVVIGARFIVRSTNTAQAWGVVEIIESDVPESFALLRCVEPTVRKFWEALADRVEESDAPPQDVSLEPYTLEFNANPSVLRISVTESVPTEIEDERG